MRYLSVCSGIEAATVAWRPLGWEAAAFSEIEPFPRAVLAHHYPNTPLHGDFTTITGDEYGPIDLVVGGTPCQDFSIAGLRAGFSGGRGNLTLEFIRLLERVRPRWVVWENVPGILSHGRGRTFGTFIGALAEYGYGFAYRVLDAQYFGVPQRRRRVFVIGHLGNWQYPAQVLFEPESLRGDITPCREAGQEVAGTFKIGSGSGGWSNGADHAADGNMIQVGAVTSKWAKGSGGPSGDECQNLVVGFYPNASASDGNTVVEDGVPTIRGNGCPPGIVGRLCLRRIMPLECERLQGFPDNYTLVPYRSRMASDTARYKAIGNSMAVPVMRWLGERIQMIGQIER